MMKQLFDFIQLPFLFSEIKLMEDLEICLQSKWKSHFNKNDFSGDWQIISLRSKTGKETDIHAFSQKEYLDTPLMANCPYFKEIVDSFLCEKEAVRLMNLKAKSEIKTHTDNAGGYDDGFCRIHIPILTNEKVEFIVNGKSLPMKIGEGWYANFSQPHSVKNEGETDRIHLVIDCIRNSWTDELFESMGYNFESENSKIYDEATKLQIIAQLELMNTETSRKMIENLKNG
jgi:Aspartyl/Asparaginyl beta-hydroxylase